MVLQHPKLYLWWLCRRVSSSFLGIVNDVERLDLPGWRCGENPCFGRDGMWIEVSDELEIKI